MGVGPGHLDAIVPQMQVASAWILLNASHVRVPVPVSVIPAPETPEECGGRRGRGEGCGLAEQKLPPGSADGYLFWP